MLCASLVACTGKPVKATDPAALAACRPATIDSAVRCLEQHANPKEVEAAAGKFAVSSAYSYEGDVTYLSKFADWLLWNWVECGDPKLSLEVTRLNLAHRDDFVAIAINSYVADRSGRPRNIEQQAAFYRAHFDSPVIYRPSLLPASPKRACS